MSLYDYNLSLSHLGIFFSFVFRISGRQNKHLPFSPCYLHTYIIYAFFSYVSHPPSHCGFLPNSSKDNDIPISNMSKYLDEHMKKRRNKQTPLAKLRETEMRWGMWGGGMKQTGEGDTRKRKWRTLEPMCSPELPDWVSDDTSGKIISCLMGFPLLLCFWPR